MMIMEASATAREADQAASWTESNAVGTRREKDMIRGTEPETENLAKSAKEI